MAIWGMVWFFWPDLLQVVAIWPLFLLSCFFLCIQVIRLAAISYYTTVGVDSYIWYCCNLQLQTTLQSLHVQSATRKAYYNAMILLKEDRPHCTGSNEDDISYKKGPITMILLKENQGDTLLQKVFRIQGPGIFPFLRS